MTQNEALKRIRQSHWQSLERHLKRAYQEGVEEGRSRAKGAGRHGRTIRGDATVAGLTRLIEKHFGLARYAFEVRIVHPQSGRRIPTRNLLREHLAEE